MVPQEKVEAHANRISELALNFEGQVAREIDTVVADVSAYAMKTLSTYQGVVRQSPENARRVLTVEDVFQRSLDASDYHPTVLAFIGNFVDQVDEFEELYQGVSLSTDVLTGEDRDVLSSQAAVAVTVLEGYPAQVCNELRQLLARSLGESRLTELVSEVCTVVRKVSHVGPMAKDQVNLWFRLLGSLVYRRIEERGTKLSYTYVGPETKSTRGFCSKLLAGGPLNIERISALDNGQTSDVLLNGGGYGCNHFWFGEVVG